MHEPNALAATAALEDWSPPVASMDLWEAARARIAQARHLVLLTGAGMSAESGVPTFRDAQDSHWNQMSAKEMATEAGFRRQPELVWRWYQERREQVLQTHPHAGHRAIARWALESGRACTVITQNVDGLHQRAGTPQVLALHGNLLEGRWLERPRACCDLARCTSELPPRCPVCGNRVRPGVVWFGEQLPFDVLEAAQAASADADVMLVIGTAGVVYPAAGMAHIALRNGAWVGVINPQPTDLDAQAHALLHATAAQSVPWLLRLSEQV